MESLVTSSDWVRFGGVTAEELALVRGHLPPVLRRAGIGFDTPHEDLLAVRDVLLQAHGILAQPPGADSEVNLCHSLRYVRRPARAGYWAPVLARAIHAELSEAECGLYVTQYLKSKLSGKLSGIRLERLFSHGPCDDAIAQSFIDPSTRYQQSIRLRKSLRLYWVEQLIHDVDLLLAAHAARRNGTKARDKPTMKRGNVQTDFAAMYARVERLAAEMRAKGELP